MEHFMTTIFPIVLSFLAGTGLIILEVFLPGFGLPGISGVLLIGLGTWLTATMFSVGTGILVLMLVLIVLAAILAIMFRFASNGMFQDSPLFLKSRESKPETAENKKSLLGKIGKTVTMLRPAGIAEIENQRVDVVTDGDYIEPNVSVKVSRVDGNRIVVSRG